MSSPEQNGWTTATYSAHNEALRTAKDKLDEERDRRYVEVKAAEDKALSLQAEKNEFHFEALNHEQARLLADRERYLPRETYMADRKDRMAVGLAVLSLVVALLTLAALIWQGTSR